MPDLQTELLTTWEQFKAKNDEAIAEAKRTGTVAQELKNSLDAMSQRFDQLETEMKRPAAGGIDSKSADSAQVKAFRGFLAGGLKSLSPDEQKAVLQADNDQGGGFLVMPTEMVSMLLKAVDDLTPIRGLARKFQVTKAEALGVPTLEANPNDADWTAEIAAVTDDTAMTFGRRELRPHPLSKLVKISRKLLRAAAMSPEQIVMDRLAYKFALTENKAFLTGDGQNKPLGIFTASNDGITTARDKTSASATAFTADELIDAKFNQKAQYWPNLRWVFHRDFLARARKLKDGQGQYLWQPGLNGLPGTLIDTPYVLDENAPNTFTTGQYVAVIGDFSYYWIVDALNFEVQRLEELYAATNQVGFIGRQELDGAPVLAEAFTRMKLA